MEFAFLTSPDVENVAIDWDANLPKTPEIVNAALGAGFSKWEVGESPIGLLKQDFSAGGWMFRAGARTIIGMNGSTLVEIL
jgi:hypothetical protein